MAMTLEVVAIAFPVAPLQIPCLFGSRYLKTRTPLALRDFRTFDGNRLLLDIARNESLSRRTLGHIKSMLSGVFTYARRQGILNTPNPMRAPIPVIAPLEEFLEQHRLTAGNPATGLMFPNSLGKPLNFDELAFRLIKPALTKSGIAWHGWHAFRRGLATNLYRLGVKDKTIQAILRHSNLSLKMNAYVKSVSLDSVAAMQQLESLYATNAVNMQRSTKKTMAVVQ